MITPNERRRRNGSRILFYEETLWEARVTIVETNVHANLLVTGLACILRRRRGLHHRQQRRSLIGSHHLLLRWHIIRRRALFRHPPYGGDHCFHVCWRALLSDDVTLEEVLHLIQQAGYGVAYPALRAQTPDGPLPRYGQGVMWNIEGVGDTPTASPLSLPEEG